MAHPRTTAPASPRERSPVPTESAVADPNTPAPALSLVEDSDAQKLDRLLADFGNVDGFTAKLERIRTPGVAAELCGHLQALPFTDDFLDDVRQEYGGGKFRARIYDGHKDYRTSFSFTIAGGPRPLRESDPAASVGVGPASAGDGRLDRIIEALASSTAALTAAVGAMQTRPQEDELERLAKYARVMRELNPPAAASASPLETVKTFLQLQELLDERTPRGGDSGGIAAIVEHGVKPIAQVMSRSLDIQERAMQRADERRRIPTTTARAGEGEAQAPGNLAAPINSDSPASDGDDAARSTSEGRPVYALARSIPTAARMYLARQAAADRDPDSYAVLILDTIEEDNPDVYAAMPELVQHPDFLPALLEEVPQWAPYPEWFSRLVDALRVQLSDDDEAAAEPTTPGADE